MIKRVSKPAPSSDSESDDGINIDLLREAADQELINDSMFEEVGKNNSNTTKTALQPQFKSQRYVEATDGIDNDLHVPESMQTFVYKKLSQILAEQIEFVEVKPKKVSKKKKPDAPVVRLLSDTDPIVLQTEDELVAEWKVAADTRKRPHIQRRKVEDDGWNEDDKYAAVATTADDIVADAKRIVRQTHDRNVYHYKEIKSQLYLVEADTEFTKQRKKNNWSESKIARK